MSVKAIRVDSFELRKWHFESWVARQGVVEGEIADLGRIFRERPSDVCLLDASGFECFSRKAMAFVLERGVLSRANFFQTEIRLMMHSFRWLEVPIRYRNENFRIGRSCLREALRVLWHLRRTRRSHPP